MSKLRKHGQNETLCINAMKKNGMHLRYVLNQTHKICMAACRQNGLALQYVEEQTHDICMAACKQNGMVLTYVKEQTPDICMVACRQNGLALRYVWVQTHDICMEACKQNKWAFDYVDVQTYKICAIACRQAGNNINWVRGLSTHFPLNPDDEILSYEQKVSLYVIAMQNGFNEFYKINPVFHTSDIISIAIKQNPVNISHISKRWQTYEICELVLTGYWWYMCLNLCLPRYINLRSLDTYMLRENMKKCIIH